MTDDRYKIEIDEGWRKACNMVPFIKLPPEWKIAVIPPFGGAMARFLVKLPSGTVKSVYLDFYNALGIHGDPPTPYWEVHPYRGDFGRCDMIDTRKLLRMIGDERQ